MADEARWYVVHTYSGYENKVKLDLDKMIKNRKLEDKILEVLVPTQEVIETRKAEDEGPEKVEYTDTGERKPPRKKKVTSGKTKIKKLYPGYVFIRMVKNEQTWYLVRNTRGVTGFVGSVPSEPIPLTEEEMKNLGVGARALSSDAEFKVGDSVRVIKKEWANYPDGVVMEVDASKQTVKISIPDFMNGAPVSLNLSFSDIAKI